MNSKHEEEKKYNNQFINENFTYSAWRFFTNLSHDMEVLYVHTEGFQGALPLARETKHVFCLSIIHYESQSLFHTVKKRYNNISFVTLPKSGEFPFQNNFFDMVVIHDVNELLFRFKNSVIFSSVDNWPINEATRVLKKDGRLYLGMRRRNIKDFIFDKGTIKPTFLKIKKVLRRFGYGKKNILWMHDDLEGTSLYRIEPVIGCQLNSVIRFFLRARAFAIIAYPKSYHNFDSFQTQFIYKVMSRLGLEEYLQQDIFLGFSNTYLISTKCCIVRVSTDKASMLRCRNNFRVLRELEQLSFSFAVPKALSSGEYQGKIYHTESRLNGHPVEYLHIPVHRRRKLRKKSMLVLNEMHNKTGSYVTLKDEDFNLLFEEPMERLTSYVSQVPKLILDAVKTKLKKKFFNNRIFLCRMHGDFKIANILWDQHDQLSGIVDWDLSIRKGLPLIDLITYIAFDKSNEQRITIAQAVYEIAFNKIRDKTLFEGYTILDNYNDYFFNSFGLMTLIHYAVSNLAIIMENSRPVWFQKYIGPFIQKSCMNLLELSDSVELSDDS